MSYLGRKKLPHRIDHTAYLARVDRVAHRQAQDFVSHRIGKERFLMLGMI
jgi:hypothetical protein